MKILRTAEPETGNGNPATPAADAVITGTKTKVELELEQQLADERANHGRTADEKKQREIRISELENELHRLRELQSVNPSPSDKAKRGMMEKFLSGDSDE